jgi:hypothetical protein
MRSSYLTETFDSSHDSEIEYEFDPRSHITKYAATNSSEDFAEILTVFLKKRGKTSNLKYSNEIKLKFRFVRDLFKKIKNGESSW